VSFYTVGLFPLTSDYPVAKTKESTMNFRTHPMFSKDQHCTHPDCFTFSHTADYCSADQPRFCECAFDYAEGFAASVNEDPYIGSMENVKIRQMPEFSETQHCRNPDCFTFSHTASYCSSDQPRFCECAYDYPEGFAAEMNERIAAYQ
jgi:hypothetical protein